MVGNEGASGAWGYRSPVLAPQVTRWAINVPILSLDLDEEPCVVDLGRTFSLSVRAALDEGGLGTYIHRVETHFLGFIHSSALVRSHFATVCPL